MKMQKLRLLMLVYFYAFLQLAKTSLSQNQKTDDVKYHMGPVLTSQINLNIIWYGATWTSEQQSTIKAFITSLSSPSHPYPSVSDWWRTVTLYDDQTNSSIAKSIKLSREFHDLKLSQGGHLSRLSMQSIVKSTVSPSFPLDYTNGLYLILTSSEVTVDDFCRAVCGFHYFTFRSVVGAIVPYAWVGYSGKQCPETCAYPFVFPKYGPKGEPVKPPNGDVGTDAMISVIAHELAEASSNPLINAWYAGDEPMAPREIADLCEGIYGTGAYPGYPGDMYKDSHGNSFNLFGVNGKKFLVQWVWDRFKRACYGPNARKGH